MAYNNGGYGGRTNPYAQQGNSYDQSIDGGYGQAPPSYGGAMGRGDLGSENVEMEPLTGARNNFPPQGLPGGDPNYILNECARVDEGINVISQKLREMDIEQKRSLGQTDASANSPANKAVERLNNDIMAAFRELAGNVQQLKSKPDANQPRNAPTIGRVTRRLKEMRQQYQNERHQFELAMREQARRQVLIVKPDATAAEINDFIEDPSNNQIFSQALMQSGRQGQATSALNAVSSRHAEIQKIEQQMIELAEMFTEMENLVVQQEVAVTQIEAKGEEVQDNLYKGNEQIEVAITTARSTRRKKWWCLGISLLILTVIVVVVVIYFLVIKGGTSTTTVKTAKRAESDRLGAMFHQMASDRAVVPGVAWNPPSTVSTGRKHKRSVTNIDPVDSVLNLEKRSIDWRRVVAERIVVADSWTPSTAADATAQKRAVDEMSQPKQKRYVVTNAEATTNPAELEGRTADLAMSGRWRNAEVRRHAASE